MSETTESPFRVHEPREQDADKTTHKPGAQTTDGRRKHAANRFSMFNTFCDKTMHDLTLAEAAVWMLLWRDTKSDGTACSAQSYLASRVGVTERTVRRAIKDLKNRGLLTVVRRGNNKGAGI